MIKPIVLKNNLTILRLPKPGSRSCVVGFVAATGASHEHGFFPQGISYLIEKMFLRGTTKYPNQRALNLAIESIGGEFESLTTEEHMHFYIHAPSQHQEKALSILTDIIQNSSFNHLALEREKKKIVEEIKFGEERIQDILNINIMGDIFPDSGFGEPLKGSIDSILSISVDDVQEYLSHQFTNEKSYLILAGNFDNKAILDKAEQEWVHYQPKTKRFLDTPEITSIDLMDRDFPSINYHQRGLPQTFMVLSFLNSKYDPENKSYVQAGDRVRQMVRESFISCLLGEGISSKLWVKVVEDEVLAHYASSSVEQFSLCSLLEIRSVVDNSQFTFALESILSVLESLKKTTVSINEIARTKEILKGRWILQQESTIAEVIWQVDNLISLGDLFSLDDLFEMVDEIDATTVRDLATQIFDQNRLVVTILGTAKETKLVEKLIKRYLQ